MKGTSESLSTWVKEVAKRVPKNIQKHCLFCPPACYLPLTSDLFKKYEVEILLGSPAVQKYILEAREGELLDIIRKSHEEGMIDYTSALVQLVEDEVIHHKVALESTPKPEELKMRLKGIS